MDAAAGSRTIVIAQDDASDDDVRSEETSRKDTTAHEDSADLEDVMDQLAESTEGQDEVQIQSIMDAFGGRLFGPVILVPALIAVTPLGAVPFVPTAIGTTIVLIAVQRLFGSKHPWIPKAIRDRGVERSRMTGAFDRFRPWASRIDLFIRARWTWLLDGPMERLIAAIVVVLGLTMPPLELLPFAVLAPASAVLMLGLAITGRDGLLAALGIGLSVASVGLVIWWLAF